MRYKTLGPTGLRVSEACLGTMTFGEDWGWGAPEETCRAIYEAFREAGGNFVDTANLYVNGESERITGRLIAERRDEVVLATKYSNAMAPMHPNAGGNHRKSMVQALEGSLKRLGTDRIDLYWVHNWDFGTPAEEIMRGLDDLVRAGKILHIGLSDAPAWAAAQCNTMAELRGWTRFAALQVEYSLIERTAERELMPMADAFGLDMLAWSPLAGGLLTGKYNEGSGGGSKDGSGNRRLDVSDTHPKSDRNLAIAQKVVDVAKDLGTEPAAVALRWTMDRGTIPLIGATKLEQLESNLSALDLTLDADQTKALDEASAIDLGFPHAFLTATRNMAWGGAWDDLDKRSVHGLQRELKAAKGQELDL
ncbi:aldo/keto reductase [Jannaschia sp. Os4]|uniref:aldo/keto reductase n=1 Tax=Jannaschia sp. Os4 TaxID=2807617 RepID=UPI001939BE0D|nr:aldo/keto reductase [Jannaschia sp. Os4]MBM2578131.1 aldo/keto reductase [Jannaschia sp. Os4]